MKTILNALITLLACFLSLQLIAQNYSTNNKKAIKLFENAQQEFKVNRNFDEGLSMLEKAVDIDHNFTEAHATLAGNYHLLGQQDKALEHYKSVYEQGKDNVRFSGVIFDLGTIYFEDADYSNALDCFQAVEKTAPGRYKRNHYYLLSSKFSIEALKNPYDFQPKELPATINKFKFQSNPQLTADGEQMIFSIRAGMGVQFDEQIAIVSKENGEWGMPRNISDNINTPTNEGFASITGDGKTIVFTSCDRADGLGRCDLYISEKVGNEWSKAVNMGETVNSPAWESGPAITADGHKIYFSSDRGGGKGEKDLWYTEKGKNGEWTKPKNLGEPINTEFSEVTPFIHADGETLFFASDGHPGLGGYDVFYTRDLNGTWTSPFNLGYPMNTNHNEGSLFITPDNEKGYFEKYVSMGRDSYSRLYEVDLPLALQVATPSIYAKGVVTDAITKRPISALVGLVDLSAEEMVQKVTSDSVNGNYLIVLSEGINYGLFVEKEGYLFFSKNFDFMNNKFDPQELNIELLPISEGKTLTLNNVFFESGSYKLLEQSEAELGMISKLMKQRPELKFKIEGHTDNVGDKTSNVTLSKNRAQSVYDYLLMTGIDKSRLSYQGYGETKSVADNTTAEGRAENRRIEIRVVK